MQFIKSLWNGGSSPPRETKSPAASAPERGDIDAFVVDPKDAAGGRWESIEKETSRAQLAICDIVGAHDSRWCVYHESPNGLICWHDIGQSEKRQFNAFATRIVGRDIYGTCVFVQRAPPGGGNVNAYISAPATIAQPSETQTIPESALPEQTAVSAKEEDLLPIPFENSKDSSKPEPPRKRHKDTHTSTCPTEAPRRSSRRLKK